MGTSLPTESQASDDHRGAPPGSTGLFFGILGITWQKKACGGLELAVTEIV